MIFLAGGTLPFLWITWLGVRFGIKATTVELPPETLFVEEHAEAQEDRTGFPVGTGVSSSRSGSLYGRGHPDRGEDGRQP